ncbi:uncharacterized protein LOC133142747 [Syngnathus typhle]|uniref:uncharacterized protein LOC133142747 n=1 Tax=Syngnathus typhle TaxID=161592 RepID=UPI002A6A80E2|nr:uncharacterized protein LOC133142747 [Syngnathus typhle]
MRRSRPLVRQSRCAEARNVNRPVALPKPANADDAGPTGSAVHEDKSLSGCVRHLVRPRPAGGRAETAPPTGGGERSSDTESCACHLCPVNQSASARAVLLPVYVGLVQRSSMESAEALSANQKSRRNVTIEISNLTGGFVLRHPRVHMENGDCHSPPQPTVRPMCTEVCNFNKTDAATSGAVGVLTYEIFEGAAAVAKLAIMFSVPYDYTFYKNWVAVGVFPKERETDKKLYEEMYEAKELKNFVRQKANGCGLNYESGKMDVKVTMSPMGRAIMKVELWDLHFRQ